MSHTPGPWQACNSASISVNEDVLVVPNHVRRVFVQDGLRYTQFIADCNALPEATDNARLIAAAPDLLTALTVLYEETADYIRLNHLGDVHHNHSMQLARDAIAKAKGK